MNILILGGTQACGSGLPDGKSYVAQFVRRLKGARHGVRINYYPVTLAEAAQLVSQLRLAEYDLILLQFDSRFDWLPVSFWQQLVIKGLLRLKGDRLAPLTMVRDQLAKVLRQVRVYNRQVILLSPLPHRNKLEQGVVEQTYAIYKQQSQEWQVPLFDVGIHLAGGDELFQPDSSTRLSAVAHELLGSELHTFITEPTYTLWS